MIVIFQPHRPSRLKSLVADFSSAFYGADFLVVTDVYLASEKPQRGINAALLIKHLRYPGRKNIVYLPQSELKRNLVSFLKPADVLLALGAGDIDSVVRSVYKHF